MDLVWVGCPACAGEGMVGDDECPRCEGDEGWNMPENAAPEPDQHGERWGR